MRKERVLAIAATDGQPAKTAPQSNCLLVRGCGDFQLMFITYKSTTEMSKIFQDCREFVTQVNSYSFACENSRRRGEPLGMSLRTTVEVL